MERGLPYWFQFGMALSDGRILGIPATWVCDGRDANAQRRIGGLCSVVRECASSHLGEKHEWYYRERLRSSDCIIRWSNPWNSNDLGMVWNRCERAMAYLGAQYCERARAVRAE